MNSWQRPQDWPEMWQKYVSFHSEIPMEWGYHDCVQFSWGWLHTLGHPAAAIIAKDIPPYTSIKEAIEIIARLTGKPRDPTFASLGDLVDMYLKPYDFPRRVSRGDIGLVEMDGRNVLSVCDGENMFGPGKQYLMASTITRVTKAWKV